jgi:hypothetical protein
MSSLQQRSTEEAVLDSVKSEGEGKMKGLLLEESIARNLKTAEQLYENDRHCDRRDDCGRDIATA